MTQRWQRIESIFGEALQRPPADRDAYVRQVCANDPELLREVTSLLANHREEDRTEPWAAAAAQLLAAPSLVAGQELGPYRITSFLAAGGMGAVYRAHDPRTGRDVAIKVAEQRFSERFTSEVHAVASLNHPNICTLYDVGSNYLVMELVDGPTLASRIAAGPISLDEAIPIARQIANALEEAHEKGVVHRDLKPGNIKITPSGLVKVLDFGLAQVAETAGATITQSPTFAINATEAGMLVGTAAYMAPEQARGKPVDKRADIWAFGVVFYEMLTSEQLFAGETVSDTIAAVLTKQVDFDRVSQPARSLLRRCLERDPKKRLRDIGDAMAWLDEVPADIHDDVAPVRTRRLWPAAAMALALVTAVALWIAFAPREPSPAGLVYHFTIPAPSVPFESDPRPSIAISRDGSRIVFGSRLNGTGLPLYLRAFDDPVPKPIPGTEGGWLATFSPRGDAIAFATRTELKTVALSGGSAVPLRRGEDGSPQHLDWGGDGDVVFQLPRAGILRIPARGGESRAIVPCDPKRPLVGSALLPGGTHLLVTASSDSSSTAAPGSRRVQKLMTIDVRTRDTKELLDHVDPGMRFAATGSRPDLGHILFTREGSLLAAPLDIRTFEIGDAVVVVPREERTAVTAFDVADSGTLVYATNDLSQSLYAVSTLTWVDRQGREQPLGLEPRRYRSPGLSPDGSRLAVSVVAALYDVDLWVGGVSPPTLRRATLHRASDGPDPVWSADGARLFYVSNSGDHPGEHQLYSLSPDRGENTLPLQSKRGRIEPRSVSRNGVLIAESRTVVPPCGAATESRNSFWTLKADADGGLVGGEPLAFLEDRHRKQDPQFSPDGKWIAFVSNQTGRDEVYLAPYPGPGSIVPVSTTGGTGPRWNPQGGELFFRNGDRMMAVAIETATGRVMGTPHELFAKPYPMLLDSGYSVDSGGQRFLMLKAVPGDPPTTYHVIVNWHEELKRLVPTR